MLSDELLLADAAASATAAVRAARVRTDVQGGLEGAAGAPACGHPLEALGSIGFASTLRLARASVRFPRIGRPVEASFGLMSNTSTQTWSQPARTSVESAQQFRAHCSESLPGTRFRSILKHVRSLACNVRVFRRCHPSGVRVLCTATFNRMYRVGQHLPITVMHRISAYCLCKHDARMLTTLR